MKATRVEWRVCSILARQGAQTAVVPGATAVKTVRVKNKPLLRWNNFWTKICEMLVLFVFQCAFILDFSIPPPFHIPGICKGWVRVGLAMTL